jgi:hypothetical protein
MKERYYFTQLEATLELAIHCDVGTEGVEILIHGWIRKGGINRETLRTRRKRDGESWLSYFEVQEFSKYAGYDLTAD